MENGKEIVREQYHNANKLNIRISIHEKYSTNKIGFGKWIISKYQIRSNAQILELGCGTGDMWKDHLNLLDNGCRLYLTDISEGMVNYAKSYIGKCPNIFYDVADIENIPFKDKSFDVVISNMMLYHVQDINRGLEEVTRVLKYDGNFYCTTYGENGIIGYITKLLERFGVEEKTNKSFTLQNGETLLKKYFSSVHRIDYKDSLAVTNIEDLLDYIYSLSSMTGVEELKRDSLKMFLTNQMKDGVLHIPKEYGMFVCRK